MLSYELCKQLKDAGFPQTDLEHQCEECSMFEWYNDEGSCFNTRELYPEKDEEWIYKPTLSELIDACVKLSETGDFHLERTTIGSKEAFVGWGASVDCFKGEPYIEGKTPEEAVAKLYLEINKK